MMKIYLGLVGLVLALGVVCGEPPEELKKLIDECAKESGVSLKGLPDFNDPKVKCFTACVMKKGGMLNDGKIVVEKTLETAAKHVPNGGSDAAKTVITECANKANEEKDECEVSGNFYKCAMEKHRP